MFKKFTIKTTIIISIIVGLLLTIYAGFISKHYIIKNQEKKITLKISYVIKFYPLSLRKKRLGYTTLSNFRSNKKL